MFTDLKPYPAVTETGVDWLERCPQHWRLSPGMALLVPVKTKNTDLMEDTVLSLSFGRIVVKPRDKLHGLVPASFATYQVLDPGAVVIRPTDLQNDQRSARVGLVRNRGIITSAYLAFDVKGGLASDYAFGYLSALDSLRVYYGMGSGLRQNLDWSDFKRLPMLLPPAEEQGAIVRYLGHANRRIDQAVAAKRKLIRLLEEQKQVIINQAVTGGTDPNVPMRESASLTGGVPAHWTRARLKFVAQVQTGLTLGKDYGSAPLEHFAYLRVANVQVSRLDLSEVTTVDVPHREAANCTLATGDVLMTEGGDIDKLGRAAIWRGEIPNCLHQNHLFAVRCSSQLVPEYLVSLLESRVGRNYFFRTAKKTTNLASTNSTILKAFPFELPDRDEQLRILESIAHATAPITRAIEQAQREIELLREFRTRLTADVVTGQVDVRAIAATLPDVELAEPDSGSHEAADDALDDELFEDLEES